MRLTFVMARIAITFIITRIMMRLTFVMASFATIFIITRITRLYIMKLIRFCII